MRKVGRAVTFDASGSEKETRERLRGGAKNHGANGSLRGGEDHTGSRLHPRGGTKRAGAAAGLPAGLPAGVPAGVTVGSGGVLFLVFLRLRSCNSLLDLIY